MRTAFIFSSICTTTKSWRKSSSIYTKKLCTIFKDQESTIRSEINNRIRTKKDLNDRISIKRIHIDNPGDTRDIIMFLTYFESFYPLEYAINIRDTKLVKQLLDAGASPNISFRKPIATYLGLGTNPTRPALYWATDLGLASVKLMIKKVLTSMHLLIQNFYSKKISMHTAPCPIKNL